MTPFPGFPFCLTVSWQLSRWKTWFAAKLRISILTIPHSSFPQCLLRMMPSEDPPTPADYFLSVSPCSHFYIWYLCRGKVNISLGCSIGNNQNTFMLHNIYVCAVNKNLPWGFKLIGGPDKGSAFGLDAKPKPDAPERFFIESMYQTWPRLVA